MFEGNVLEQYKDMQYSPLQRLWVKKNWAKSEEKNEKKYEKRRNPLPDATPKTRVIRGSTFLHA